MKKKDLIFIHLPVWKAYLYSLLHRYKIYRWANSGVLHTGFNKQDADLFQSLLHKYVGKEVLRKPRAYWYNELVDKILFERVETSTKKEKAIAKKLLIIKKINLEELMSELKEIKKFAKEVGMKEKEIGKLDVEELTMEIIGRCDPKASYTPKFVEWYDSLPEEYFDESDSIKEDEKEEAGADTGDIDQAELLEAIDEVKKKDELLEIAEQFDSIFDVKALKKIKLPTQIKKMMKDTVAEAFAGDNELSDEEKEAIVEAIGEAESSEELKEMIEDDEAMAELFDGIKFKEGKGRASKFRDVDEVKAELFEALGVEVEESEEEEDEEADTEEADERYAEYEAMGLKELKKAAKDDFGIKVKIGMKEEAILELIAEKLQEEAGEEEEEEEEIELTSELVDEMEEAGDKDGLLEACEALEIELKAIEKRSVKSMAKKLREVVSPESAKKGVTGKGKGRPQEEEEEGEEEGEESASIYQIVEDCLVNGDNEKKIIKAITPYYTERGMKALAIKKRAKQLIECVSVDLD
jgi:hypothetical protein